MKYFVMLGDGMADWPIKALDGKTPLEVAHKPMMDHLCSLGVCGTVETVPEGMVPESDTANLGVLGYDPQIYSKGRSPLEAASIGLEMRTEDVAFRTNLLTISENGEAYDDKIMIDHSADEITTEEADELIKTLQEVFGDDSRRFYTGVSYRHCMLWEAPPPIPEFARPHDILGRTIGAYLPPEPYGTLMRQSFEVLKDHPVNVSRRERGLKPANSAWFWSPGTRPSLPNFTAKYGLTGCVISAVDLIRGIAKVAGMQAPLVEGATGTFHTNYRAKANAAIKAFKDGADFVYVHVEAPDECGHRAEIEHKVRSIEYLDSDVLVPVKEWLDASGEDYRILFLPDHPTPIEIRTHAREAVPFVIYDRRELHDSGISSYTEANLKKFGTTHLDRGPLLMDLFIK